MVGMDEFVLYIEADRARVNPVHLCMRLYQLFCDMKQLKEVPTSYWWNGAGDLPVLRYGEFVFHQSKIIPFLQETFDLDFDLSAQERALSSLLHELCVSALHPCTLFALAAFPDLPSWPLLLLERLKQRFHTRWFLTNQHYLVSAQEACRKVQETHERLSKCLGEKDFFFRGEGARPHSADLIVYAYLKEELANLPKEHEHVKNFEKFPNLVAFMGRIEKLATQVQPRLLDFSNVQQFLIPPPLAPLSLPLVYPRPSRDYSGLRSISKGAEPPARGAEDYGLSRRGYVTGTSVILLLYLFFKEG
jgi:hypothetical protein